MKINRFSCGNGEGMFENKKGYWVSYEDHLKALKELEENLTIPVVVVNEANWCYKCQKPIRITNNTLQLLCECEVSEVEFKTVELDKDFAESMDRLMLSDKFKNPTKKRF